MGTKWQITAVDDGHGKLVAALSNHPVTATFSADGKINGKGGCNGYGGSYMLDTDQIKISDLISTMMACFPNEIMQQEARYMAGLRAATHLVIEGDKLYLTADDGTHLVELKGT